MPDPLITVSDLKKYFPVAGGILSRPKNWVHAVDGVSLQICEGETLGLVGESGCGKTTVGRLILRLLEPTAGHILYQTMDITTFTEKQMNKLRRDMQMVFQDPYWSLNPRMNVRRIVSEPLDAHFKMDRSAKDRRVSDLLGLVGLSEDSMWRFPHEFSGGQRQRICISRALALSPKFVLLDEPTSALDVSVQAKIINLLTELQEKLGLTYLFISHDLKVVHHLSQRVAVMYLGKIVEVGDAEELFVRPLHPYTKALVEAVPIPDPSARRSEDVLGGDVPSPVNPPPGCRFHTRCPVAIPTCREREPQLIDHGEGHLVACHLVSS